MFFLFLLLPVEHKSAKDGKCKEKHHSTETRPTVGKSIAEDSDVAEVEEVVSYGVYP